MLTLLRTTSDNPEFRGLIIRLDQELWARYGAEQAEYDRHNKIESNRTVVVAYVTGEAVGCGCFKPFDQSSIEIKRMYVSPTHRGKGIALAIIKELEQWAIEEGFYKAVLETGVKQPEAIAVYSKAGYSQVPNFGPYVAIKSSVCMAKTLSSPR